MNGKKFSGFSQLSDKTLILARYLLDRGDGLTVELESGVAVQNLVRLRMLVKFVQNGLFLGCEYVDE